VAALPQAYEGVALLVLTQAPRSWSNLVLLLHNVLANTPTHWPLQLVLPPHLLPQLLQQPGLRRLLCPGALVEPNPKAEKRSSAETAQFVDLSQERLPSNTGNCNTTGSRLLVSLIPKSSLSLPPDRRGLLLSSWLWRSVAAEAVLVLDTPVALCGNSPKRVTDFVGHYDWVGAAWKWAKPGSVHEFGGNGALSLRNRTALLRVLSLHSPPAKGNEDMWFVARLHALSLQDPTIRLAPRSISESWAVEEIFHASPFGVYHLMRSMDDTLRGRVLDFCPEARRLFPARHEPTNTRPSSKSKNKQRGSNQNQPGVVL